MTEMNSIKKMKTIDRLKIKTNFYINEWKRVKSKKNWPSIYIILYFFG